MKIIILKNFYNLLFFETIIMELIKFKVIIIALAIVPYLFHI